MAKIFISHSSNDKEIIDLFKNKILNGGLGIADEDIAYTSAPETGVTIGNNIPQYIKDNIASCDFVFFMISENYRKSEVCLNEMGAAWALDKCIKPFIIGDIGFGSIGWLYGRNLGAKIDDGELLDELRDTFTEQYGQKTKTVVWNKYKAEFISSVAEVKQPILLPVVVEDARVVELGLLDYLDVYDEEQSKLLLILNNITTAIVKLGENTTKRTSQIVVVKSQPQTKSTRSHMRAIFAGFAKEIDCMSELVESEIDNLKLYYDSMVDCAVRIKSKYEEDSETRQQNISSMTEFMAAILSAREAIMSFAETVEESNDMEQNFMTSRDRLVDNCKTLVTFFDGCLIRIPELLK
ncbi:MAG: toll/interleukin-1 receptor domain-containing protein [Rikenellaceae bacterium]